MKTEKFIAGLILWVGSLGVLAYFLFPIDKAFFFVLCFAVSNVGMMFMHEAEHENKKI